MLIDSCFDQNGEEVLVTAREGKLMQIGKNITPLEHDFMGEAVGLMKISRDDIHLLGNILDEMVGAGKVDVEYEDAYQILFQRTDVGYVTTNGLSWIEMDTQEDLRKAEKLPIPTFRNFNE